MELLKISDDSVLVISDNFVWVDEFTHVSITQDLAYTIGGSLVVSETPMSQAILSGGKITLESGDGVGVTRATIKALYELSQLPNELFMLTLPDTTVKQVMFDKTNTPVAGKPLTRINAMPDDHPYTNVVLKFIEIAL